MDRFANMDRVTTRNGYHGVYLSPHPTQGGYHFILLDGRDNTSIIKDDNLFRDDEFFIHKLQAFSTDVLARELTRRGACVCMDEEPEEEPEEQDHYTINAAFFGLPYCISIIDAKFDSEHRLIPGTYQATMKRVE